MPADRLTALDASFLHLEDEASHMHVASVTIFEGPPPTYQEFLGHIEARLSLVPRYRQKLRFVPFNQGRPVWVDDPHFNLEYHVRSTALPPPGSEEQLKNLASRVFAQQLDRTKPLWEIWLVQGLERGDESPSDARRFALLAKTHHAVIDGVAGVDITSVLFDTAPEPETQPAPGARWHPRPEPTSVQLLSEALIERLTQPGEILRSARAAFRAPRQLARRGLDSMAAVGALAKTGLAAPSSPLNVDIGPHRRYDWVRTDLNELKEIKDRLGGTVNDVVLTIVTGALRTFLEKRGEEVDELTLRAMVPVSVRREEEYGQAGNRVAAMMAPLPIYEIDPVERLHIIREQLADLKQGGQAVGAQVLTQLSGMAPPTVMAQASRLQSRQRFFNLVVTNVPGPQIPLYVLGRQLLDLFPMAPLARRQALCIAVMSYHGRMNFGLLGDFDAMPDMRLVAEGLETSLAELRTAAGLRKRRAPKRAAAARRTPAAARSGSNGNSG
ncbi:MAG: wax ester/triacylglycerol synthase family O-acyltransferase [Candidatus Rokuibacteriota bacterium]|nr:MAG: wax ester/triacylglycerol synthase family O-acyltransferase [Candidatus Rokubacteria bacterium]